MSSGGTRARARGRNYVLPLAIVLVVGQIAAFVAIKMSKDDKPAADTPQPAIAANDLGGSGSSVATLDVPPAGSGAPSEATNPTPAPPTAPDQPVPDTENPSQPEPPVAEPPPVIDEKIHDDDSDAAKKAKRELAKQKAIKDKAEKAAREKQEKAEKAERDRREADERRREADAKRATDVEKARLAADAEKARLAAEKAKAEAAAEQARLEQEKLKAAAAAKQVAETTATDAKPKGSSSVLVLVLGPGVSSPSREAIRNVYLGKTSVWPNGTTAHPMNRPSGSSAGRKFFGGILGMSGGEFKEHWSELQLSGGGIAPSTVSSATTMIAKVAATRGGMGYVLESELPENTKGVTLVRLK